MRARTCIPVACLLLAALTLPTAAAGHAEPTGWTTTGDVDAYNTWTRTHPSHWVCTADIRIEHVTLELLHAEPGDRVLLSAEHYTANATVATYDDPVVTVTVTSGGCGPAIQVTGLTVNGDLAYELT